MTSTQGHRIYSEDGKPITATNVLYCIDGGTSTSAVVSTRGARWYSEDGKPISETNKFQVIGYI